MKFGLPDDTIEKINAVFEKYPAVEKVILYGSRAKGNYKNGSDIDLTMIGDSITSTICSQISWDLDDLPIPYAFDLSVFSELNHENLIDHINRVGKIFYQRSCADRC